jgi:hypothetical protein
MITQICISAGAAITAVCVMHIHGKWTNGDTVPGWILAITFLSKQASSSVQDRKVQNTIIQGVPRKTQSLKLCGYANSQWIKLKVGTCIPQKLNCLL